MSLHKISPNCVAMGYAGGDRVITKRLSVLSQKRSPYHTHFIKR
ncbi:hypothetical protein [Halotia branconii]|uniref:Uncharacterized protein n=1 Tax=Halotia branconii CENA392 TaxID=1539056 RepID=A0AAJ6NRU1_9CYAN|nr:hypothetical protein [Halotia branconii]WGV25564.1 hypothetical protein QI031_28190 [Halotia branconii CENA392]